MTDLEKSMLDTFYRFWYTWAERKNGAQTIQDIAPYFASNISALGTGDHEKGRDYDGVIQNFTDDFKDFDMPISINFTYVRPIILSPTSGLVEAESILQLESGGEILTFYVRFTSVFLKKESSWIMIHNHCSFPASEQDEGQAYPIDALKAKANRLEKQVKERTQELAEQKEKTENLLFSILPKTIAQELITTGSSTPARHENVSVLFSDFKEFTKIASKINPRVLVEELNEIFYAFDNIMRTFEVEKIKTVGDAYMAVCGLPEPDEDHAQKCINAARNMLEFLENRNRKKSIQWQMRVGIHSGPVVAGVVGNQKFTYDLWGETVNIASRLENQSEAGRINISNETYDLVKQQMTCSYRGKVMVKGNIEIDMYYVD